MVVTMVTAVMMAGGGVRNDSRRKPRTSPQPTGERL